MCRPQTRQVTRPRDGPEAPCIPFLSPRYQIGNLNPP